MLPSFISTLRKTSVIVDDQRAFPSAHDGEAVTITYNFMTVPRLRSDIVVDPWPTFERYTAKEIEAINRSLKAWSDTANITFVRTSAQDGDLMFGQHQMPYKIEGYAGGLTYNIETHNLRPADVWIESNQFLLSIRGQIIATHELGHALGLNHPTEGGRGLKPSDMQTSIMSNAYSGSGYRPGILDKAALQSIYGPAHKRLGDNTYELGRDKLIWDGGGSDTISAGRARAKTHLDLNDGSWSWIGRKAGSILEKGQSWTGHFSEIENAIGSKHPDVITGNEFTNAIHGGKGNDTIIGGHGADLMTGGPGNDIFVYRTFEEFGDASNFDEIVDFDSGDKMDLRLLKLDYHGNSTSDAALRSEKRANAYFNLVLHELRIDFDGNGTTDYRCKMNIDELGVEWLKL
jgi:serralysin